MAAHILQMLKIDVWHNPVFRTMLDSTKNIAVLYTEQDNKYCATVSTALVKFLHADVTANELNH